MAIYKQSTTNISQLYGYSLDMWENFGKPKPNGWEMNYNQQTKIGIIDDGKIKITNNSGDIGIIIHEQ